MTGPPPRSTSEAQPKDIVSFAFGNLQQALAAQLRKDVFIVETGIGYNGTFAKYRVFESYCHMHKLWARKAATTRTASSLTP